MRKIPLIFSIVLLIVYINLNAYESFESFQQHLKLESQRVSDSVEHQRIKDSRETRNYEVGDQKIFWRWDLSDMPPAWIQGTATCRAVGNHSYVFVDDSEWEYHMDDSDVQLVLNYLEYETMNSTEYGAIEMDINLFGQIPDELDNDPKLIVYYSALGSFQGTSFDGYFSYYNQLTESEAQLMNPPGHSNECEMIYMTCDPLNPIEPIRISVLSHELQHLIHWSYDPNETLWVNEGMSELAMVKFGIPDPISNFNSNSDNSLIVWNQEFSDYVKTMLFFTYLEEHFDNGGLISDIVAESLNSLDGIIEQLMEHGYQIPLQAVFNYWVVANYLDEPDIYTGIYNYEQLDLPYFQPVAYHSTFPVSNVLSVEPWAGEYIRINPGENILDLAIQVNHRFNLGIIIESSGDESSIVDYYTIEDDEIITLPELPENYDRIVLAIPNSDYAQLDYSYSLNYQGVDVSEEILTNDSDISCYPNPFNPETTIDFTIGQGDQGVLTLYNSRGQIIKNFGIFDDGDHEIIWNGENDSNITLASGTYLLKLETNKKNVTKKIILMK